MFAYKGIRFLAVKGLTMEASLQPDTAMLKVFMEYYASSRDSIIDILPTTHSVANMCYKFVGYLNRITKSKLNRQDVNYVIAACS